MRFAPNARYRPFIAAGVIVGLLFAAHIVSCQNSTLRYIDAVFINSDMHANLLWATGIRQQGWLNPVPYHPWTDWMQLIAPYPQWVQWWGGRQIFQQSPLYAYLLTPFVNSFLVMRILQAFIAIATSVFIGLLTARLSGRTAGWIAFWLAALYAPFYVYSWPFLRDGIGWFLTAALLWALSELTHSDWPSPRARRFAWPAGVLLGLGFLAKETFLLLIPLVWLVLAAFAWRRKYWGVVVRVAVATILAVLPLVIRNWKVNAPLLSSSNRFAELFIECNSGSSDPYRFFIPPEAKGILYETNARPLPVILATIRSHPDGVRGLMKLQFRKLGALLDPYELPDNLSIYFVEHISPVVRFGLRYWMILAPALAGLLLGIWRRERAQLWIWVLLAVTFVSLFLGAPFSRYRQSLAIFFIPLAAYFLAFFFTLIQSREYRKVAYYGASLLIGWALILGPLARYPRAQYERPLEYQLSARVFHLLGDEQSAQATEALIRQQFPGVHP